MSVSTPITVDMSAARLRKFGLGMHEGRRAGKKKGVAADRADERGYEVRFTLFCFFLLFFYPRRSASSAASQAFRQDECGK
jgi:hypothetical protein